MIWFLHRLSNLASQFGKYFPKYDKVISLMDGKSKVFGGFRDCKSSIKPRGVSLFIFELKRGVKRERGLLEKGGLLIIKNQKYYKNAFMHFLVYKCPRKALLVALKVY